MSTPATPPPPTMTPQQAWAKRVREAMRWAEERLNDERSEGEHIHLCVLVTHVRMLGFVAEKRTEERDGLLEAAKEVRATLVRMEGMDHLQRMEWFETTGIDLCDLLQHAIAKVEGE